MVSSFKHPEWHNNFRYVLPKRITEKLSNLGYTEAQRSKRQRVYNKVIYKLLYRRRLINNLGNFSKYHIINEVNTTSSNTNTQITSRIARNKQTYRSTNIFNVIKLITVKNQLRLKLQAKKQSLLASETLKRNVDKQIVEMIKPDKHFHTYEQYFLCNTQMPLSKWKAKQLKFAAEDFILQWIPTITSYKYLNWIKKGTFFPVKRYFKRSISNSEYKAKTWYMRRNISNYVVFHFKRAKLYGSLLYRNFTVVTTWSGLFSERPKNIPTKWQKHYVLNIKRKMKHKTKKQINKKTRIQTWKSALKAIIYKKYLVNYLFLHAKSIGWINIVLKFHGSYHHFRQIFRWSLGCIGRHHLKLLYFELDSPLKETRTKRNIKRRLTKRMNKRNVFINKPSEDLLQLKRLRTDKLARRYDMRMKKTVEGFVEVGNKKSDRDQQ